MRGHEFATLTLAAALAAAPAAAELRVVATLPAYAAIAQYVGGDRVTVEAISRGDEDAHFVKPKPSFALMLKRADVFVTTGLDLELWAPALVDKSGNAAIRDGQPGFVAAATGVPMLEVPASASREAGDVHIYGNPHIHTSPLNAKLVAANIVAGLARVDPAGAESYRANLERFRSEIDVAVFGEELVELLGGETLDALVRRGELRPFLAERRLEGRPLAERLGGWLARARPLAGAEIVAYHKNWSYLAQLLGFTIVDYVERKPGIPPSARHVHELLQTIERRDIKVLLAASYFSRQQIATIAERSGVEAVVVPLGPMEVTATSYFELVDGWIEALVAAVERADA